MKLGLSVFLLLITFAANVLAVPPYVLESLVLTHYEGALLPCVKYIDLALPAVFDAIASAIIQAIPDAKGIQGDLNKLLYGDRFAISDRASISARTARDAFAAEKAGDHKTAIRLWHSILGSSFPTYG